MIRSQTSLRGMAWIGLQQIALAAGLSLLLLAWLHVPDANAFEVIISVLLALLLASVAGAGESVLALRLTNRSVTMRRLVVGTVAVIVAALLWYGVSLGIDRLSANEGLRAGYLNSRFPASLRNVFTYEHISYGFGLFWSALRWLVAGLLAATTFALITCNVPLRGLLAIIRSGRYWFSLLLLFVTVSMITGSLMHWTPGHGLGVETLSLVLRLLFAILLNAAAVAFLLQAMAAALQRFHSNGTDAPELTQPRTVANP